MVFKLVWTLISLRFLFIYEMVFHSEFCLNLIRKLDINSCESSPVFGLFNWFNDDSKIRRDFSRDLIWPRQVLLGILPTRR